MHIIEDELHDVLEGISKVRDALTELRSIEYSLSHVIGLYNTIHHQVHLLRFSRVDPKSDYFVRLMHNCRQALVQCEELGGLAKNIVRCIKNVEDSLKVGGEGEVAEFLTVIHKGIDFLSQSKHHAERVEDIANFCYLTLVEIQQAVLNKKSKLVDVAEEMKEVLEQNQQARELLAQMLDFVNSVNTFEDGYMTAYLNDILKKDVVTQLTNVRKFMHIVSHFYTIYAQILEQYASQSVMTEHQLYECAHASKLMISKRILPLMDTAIHFEEAMGGILSAVKENNSDQRVKNDVATVLDTMSSLLTRVRSMQSDLQKSYSPYFVQALEAMDKKSQYTQEAYQQLLEGMQHTLMRIFYEFIGLQKQALSDNDQLGPRFTRLQHYVRGST